jgi:Tol biopolymer transport system component
VGSDGALLHLPTPVNDENSQPDLWVSPDESWMILVITDHPSGFGGDDLYLSRWDGSVWSTPSNLGPGVNSEEYEYGPTISADGQYLYFTSHRGESADVYRVLLSDVVN